MRYKCDVCDYIYDPCNGDPEHGIKAGIDLEDLPSDWVCPVCGIEKDYFYAVEYEKSNYIEKSRIVSVIGNIFHQELKKQWHNIHE
ncbi:rubredoxin [Methanobacterium sp.]|uniref:rubredoxin n=1 Tax=Methanobacterium sp. TaxID=2164 RepID=UPI003C78B9DF